jgi:small subunit ribosomal protein S8
MNTTITKLLIKLKNASFSQKESIVVEYSVFTLDIIKLLYKEGFIQSFSIKLKEKEYQKKYEILISLRYFYNKPTFKYLKIVSSPSYSHNLKIKSISKLSTKKRILVFSTSKGLLNGLECKKQNIGGTLLFIC